MTRGARRDVKRVARNAADRHAVVLRVSSAEASGSRWEVTAKTGKARRPDTIPIVTPRLRTSFGA
jgi:hypothetical protein